jgi:hypothetical protein
MTDVRKGSLPVFAFALIVLGALLLLHQLDLISFGFGPVFWSLVMVLGITRVVQGFSRGRSWRIFFGSALFLYGLLFLLGSSDYADVHVRMFLPATFLIAGIGLLMVFLNNHHEWELLVPAAFLCGIGGALVLSELGYLDSYEVWETLRMYWPVGLVLAGVALILRRRAQIR